MGDLKKRDGQSGPAGSKYKYSSNEMSGKDSVMRLNWVEPALKTEPHKYEQLREFLGAQETVQVEDLSVSWNGMQMSGSESTTIIRFADHVARLDSSSSYEK